MQPHTIINQTLHSYCKEQFEFNIQPMFINLTQYVKSFFSLMICFFSHRWPSGFIYAQYPYQEFGMIFQMIM